MRHADFTIGTEFETCTGQRWRCTDVGQRTILAIELQPDLSNAWFAGPPYPVPEVVFDEPDIKSAFLSHEEAVRDTLVEVDRGLHPSYPYEAVKTMMESELREDALLYPRPRLFRIDRVDPSGEVLHPYAAEPTEDGWQIIAYAPFAKIFISMPENDFVRLKPATSMDFEIRQQS